MPQIVKPRALLLYMVNKLEEQGFEPTPTDIIRMCTEIQSGGNHIYSFSEKPDDLFLQESITRDLRDCQDNGWLEKDTGHLSVSHRGRVYIRGMTPPLGIEEKVTAFLPKYNPKVHP